MKFIAAENRHPCLSGSAPVVFENYHVLDMMAIFAARAVSVMYILLQTACQLSYVENQNDERGVDDAHQLPQHAEEFQPVEQETSKPTALEVDSRSSPEPIVRDDVDSHVVIDVERSSTAGSVHVDR